MKAPLSYMPTLPAAIGVIVGILLHHYGCGIVGSCIVGAVGIVLILKKQIYWASFALFSVIGYLLAVSSILSKLDDNALKGKNTYVAKIKSVSQGSSSVSYLVAIDSINGAGADHQMCSLTVFSSADAIDNGATVAFVGQINELDATPDVPHQSNYASSLISQGIIYSCAISPDQIQVVCQPNAFNRFINNTRNKIFNAIVDSPITDNTAAFLVAVILGDRQYVDKGIMQSYRDLGIAHVLALSGLHVGVLASLLSLLFWPFKVIRRGNAIKSLLVLLCIWIYALACGLTPSIMRASVMITVFTVVNMMQRGYAAYNSLLISIIIVLVVNPLSLFTAGFQLSVAAVSSLLAFSSAIPKSLRRQPKLYFIVNIVVVPVAAMLGTGIVSAFYFNSLPIYFLPANIFTGLLFPWLLIFGSILSMFTSIGIEFSLLGDFVDFLYRVINDGISLMSILPNTSVRGIFFSAWAIAPYAISVACLALALHRRSLMWLTYTAVFVIVTVIVIESTNETTPDTELYITRNPGTNIIVHQNQAVYILPLCSDHDRTTSLHECNDLYQGYLYSRGVDSFNIVTQSTFVNNSSQLIIKHPYIILNDKVLYIADNDSLPASDKINVDYALISNNYKRSINDICKYVKPDTLIIANDVHPSRRKRLLRENADNIPVIDMRYQKFAIQR